MTASGTIAVEHAGIWALVLPFCQDEVTLHSMKGITIKLPEAALRRLRQEARDSGRSIAALVRERLEVVPKRDGPSVHSLTSDLAGALAGSRRAATNARRRFRRA